MLKKQDIMEIIKIGLILFAITAIAALALAAVNAKTRPIIDANNLEKQQAAMRVVLPDAENFESENLKTDKMPETVTAVYQSTNHVGYAVLVAPNGYNGAVSLAVGVSADGAVTGVDVISQSETPGLGANCTKESFRSQFIGKTTDIKVVKNGAVGNQIDAISSATVTSKAVTKGVNDAITAALLAKEAN